MGGFDSDRIAAGMDTLAAADPLVAAALRQHGPPPPRQRPVGYETLLRAIVSQQISTAAAAGIWRRLESTFGDITDPATVLAVEPEALRAAGLSMQKAAYAQSLARHVMDGTLPLRALPSDDEEAIALLSSVRGLGRWSAEIYLLFAEGRPDIFPAGDLAIRIQAGRLLGLDRPAEKLLRQESLRWSPNRGIAALFLWHCYNAPPL